MVRSADIVADSMLEGTGCAAHPATVKIRTATNAEALMMPAVPGRKMSLNTNSRKIDQPTRLGRYANHSAVSVIGLAGCGIRVDPVSQFVQPLIPFEMPRSQNCMSPPGA